MNEITLSETADGQLSIQLNGFPNARQVVAVTSDDARWLADLALHRSDLLFAERSLKGIAENPSLPADLLESWWRSAIAQVYKCFGSSKSRSRLDPDVVMAGASHEISENFKFYKAQRNKNMIHDENSYSQAAVIALLNDGESFPHKVEAVRGICLTFKDLSGQAHFNFSGVLRWILDWMEREFNEVAARVRADLETKTIEQLRAMPAPQHRSPTVDDAFKTRVRN